jgi:imidazoleglycerol phosphate synthase glutamine amidotransferase subunit HisH
MQSLFQASEESPGVEGLGIIPGTVTKFDISAGLKVPQIGWNSFSKVKSCEFLDDVAGEDAVYEHCKLYCYLLVSILINTSEKFHRV